MTPDATTPPVRNVAAVLAFHRPLEGGAMATPTTITVNGFALREIRLRTGVDVASFAEQVGVTRTYLSKIELGRNTRVSPQTYAAILAALDIGDRRALLADPHHSAVS